MHRLRLPLLAACLLAGSAAWAAGPQSFLDGNPQTKAANLYKVRIISIDGESQQQNPVALTPGPHWVEVIGPNGDKMGTTVDKSQTVVLKIQPCTYYYLGAKKDSPLMREWKLVVDSEETLTSCDPAEETRKAQAAAKVAPPKPRPAASSPASDSWSPASH